MAYPPSATTTTSNSGIQYRVNTRYTRGGLPLCRLVRKQDGPIPAETLVSPTDAEPGFRHCNGRQTTSPVGWPFAPGGMLPGHSNGSCSARLMKR
ncbi:hypothetical protein MSEN_12790 [Mycolicibacter senuensis]|uniref:Uncharacterized protein n=1 Tax=Mycolicibacter senuensis TaxID=386913 RepID=A0A7I9XHV5_9MYCO|nr:hypothetical protein MSEN_12790 [Mycolicibacter senuensis]